MSTSATQVAIITTDQIDKKTGTPNINYMKSCIGNKLIMSATDQ